MIVSCEGWPKRLCQKLQTSMIGLLSSGLQVEGLGLITIEEVSKYKPCESLVAPIIIWV